MKFRSKLLFLGVCSVLFPSLALGELVSEYKLQDNEFLFVGGKEYRELNVSFDEGSGGFFVNQFCIYSNKIEAEKGENINQFLGLSRSDTLFDRVLYITEAIKKNSTFNQAISDYRRIVSEYWKYVFSVRRELASEKMALSEANSLLHEYYLKENLSECVNIVQINEWGEFLWYPKSAKHEVFVTASIEGDGRNQDKNIGDFQGVVDFFESSSRQQLMILGYGLESYSLGDGVPEKVSQLRRVIQGSDLVEGPYDLRQLKLFGFKVGGAEE